jgi:hypothetical protein
MIRLEKVNKSYEVGDNLLHVLRDLDLTIDEGEFVSIMAHEIYADDHVIGTWATGMKAIVAEPGLVSPLDLPLGRMLKLRESNPQ